LKSSLIDIFEIEETCEYRGEIYRVRDNGAIYRLRKIDKGIRPLDEKWSFGKPDSRRAYLNFSSETVHRIVATAFHGQQPLEKPVVDHIDTNRQNNRPENLRWISKLDNILLNSITLSKIKSKYGSLDNFFLDPSKPLKSDHEPNFDWMRAVTKEESENAKNNLLKWAKEGRISKNGTLGEWVFSKLDKNEDEYSEQTIFTRSITSNAVQKHWKTPSEFPNCPSSTNKNGLKIYLERLRFGTVFSKNEFGESIVENSEINKETNELLVLTTGDYVVKGYALAKVYVDENKFVHESIKTFFKLIGAQKQFNLALGLEWEGEDSIDDYS
jgi:HNH endonuclease